ncbi:MaoC/PaaZ C-terminal domain-containing protein [Microvirga sp. 0TCS3.31]
MDQFARATGDDEWIHVDAERAERELPGGTAIARGLPTLSFAPVFARSIMGLDEVTNTLNYGADRIRFWNRCRQARGCAAGLLSRLWRTHRETACESHMALPSKSRTASVRPTWPSSWSCITAERSAWS